jgi:uncharacterized protein (TIGR02145 family)
MKRLLTAVMLTLTMANLFGQEIVMDIDGNQYETVQIGEQVWFKENLKVSRFSNGDPILELLTPIEWWQTAHYYNPEFGTPSQSYYEADTMYLNRYGRLYNWFVVDDERNVCPTGWKVPSYSEYYEMFHFVDSMTQPLLDYDECVLRDGIMNYYSGKKFLSNLYWNDNHLGGTNETGWSGLPGGQFYYNGGGIQFMDTKFSGEGFVNGFWTTDTVDWNMDGVYGRRSKTVYILGDYIRTYPEGRGIGNSIRCIKDNSFILDDNDDKGFEPNIHPNPTNGIFVFSSNDTYIDNEYNIYETNGQLVKSGTISSIQQTIDLSEQPVGVYMLRIKDKIYKVVRN